jgi:NADH-quinone oxidoreductase subunit H
MIQGSLSLKDIVAGQAGMPYIVLQPLGFLLFVVCMIAETNRAPFDLAEAESELTGGFHTEYSSMNFAVYFLAEYCNMITLSAVAATFFLGGWRGPILPPVVWFLIKIFAFMFFFMWLRASTPRLRYDQLMAFGWKVLLPLSILNVVVTAGVIVFMDS